MVEPRLAIEHCTGFREKRKHALGEITMRNQHWTPRRRASRRRERKTESTLRCIRPRSQLGPSEPVACGGADRCGRSRRGREVDKNRIAKDCNDEEKVKKKQEAGDFF
ncbi:UNVERIFIED_CONTAM: hypothetical protein HHA_449300 [Hammondia hammondi]|eukprot:XP_008881902.1 hypothetical protein HHA_449300 [Hammondia hammondi]